MVLLQTTLARVICDNSDDIRYVQHDVFKRVKRTSEYAACFQHITVDLRFWKECCSEKKSKFDNFTFPIIFKQLAVPPDVIYTILEYFGNYVNFNFSLLLRFLRSVLSA